MYRLPNGTSIGYSEKTVNELIEAYGTDIDSLREHLSDDYSADEIEGIAEVAIGWTCRDIDAIAGAIVEMSANLQTCC